MSTLDLVSDVQSFKLDLNDTAAIDFFSYCQVCMNGNHGTSQCLEIKDMKNIMRTCNRNYNRWCNRREGYSNNSSIERGKYLQQPRPQGRPFQQGQHKPWQTSNQLGSLYIGQYSKPSTVLSWNNGTRTGSPPLKATSSENNRRGYKSWYRRCKAPPH